jgi:DNA-binding Lrp family transcriptional regulator
MGLAFVLLSVEMGNETRVVNELEEISEVTESFLIYGVYDIIVRVEAENMKELKDVIGSKIRKIESVRSTLTLIAV